MTLIEDDNVIETLAPDVRPAKAGVFSRSQTCWGKSQAPRSLDAVLVGTLIILAELIELSIFRSWEEWINVALGAWLIESAWLLALRRR